MVVSSCFPLVGCFFHGLCSSTRPLRLFIIAYTVHYSDFVNAPWQHLNYCWQVNDIFYTLNSIFTCQLISKAFYILNIMSIYIILILILTNIINFLIIFPTQRSWNEQWSCMQRMLLLHGITPNGLIWFNYWRRCDNN